VSAGCENTPDGLRNDDAVALQQTINTPLTYEQINPVALTAAIAPHVAAEQEGRRITVDRLAGICRGALMKRSEFVVIEGAGGWRVPLNNRIRLGCLNHALLTAEAIRRDGLSIAGWVANQVDENMPAAQASIDTLNAWLPAPCLGHIPFLHNPSVIDAQVYLDINKLPLE